MPRLLPLLACLLRAPVWAQQAHPCSATRRVASHRTVSKANATAPVAYSCASGNIAKYHASPSCRGLCRCSASVDKMALSDAQARLEPCRVCH